MTVIGIEMKTTDKNTDELIVKKDEYKKILKTVKEAVEKETDEDIYIYNQNHELLYIEILVKGKELYLSRTGRDRLLKLRGA